VIFWEFGNLGIWEFGKKKDALLRVTHPTLDGFGWIWMDLDGFGWIWMDLGGFGLIGWGGDFADLVLDFGEVGKSIGEVNEIVAGVGAEADDFDFDTSIG
jgi:hypothetical protein